MQAEGLHQLGRLWRTLRWLRPEQFTGRLRVKLQRPRVDARPAPPVRAASMPWVLPARRAPSLLSPTRMAYLGVAHELGKVGWDAPSLPLLWRYNQHYFEDLCAYGAHERHAWHRDLLNAWLVQNPPGHGTAWAPYPTSLRICNWVKGWCAVPGVPAPDPAWVHSLAVQARWLTQRLEWHLLGNHLLANAKALLFAGVYFEGPEADGWLALAKKILLRELPEQILPDGGHFERSPMYHAIALEDMLDILNALRAYDDTDRGSLTTIISSNIPKMMIWLRAMVHTDGSLTRFNDCADDIAPTLVELERYTKDLRINVANDFDFESANSSHGVGALPLQSSGYLRLSSFGATAWLDLAPIGPNYLPAHAHADTLSFELEIGDQLIFTNRGTSEYGESMRRQVERGTGAHNTLTLAGRDSSEVWAGFRVGRRARVYDTAIVEKESGVYITASHDGYTYLPGQPIHKRSWFWRQEKRCAITDVLLGENRFQKWLKRQATPSIVRFHLVPDLNVEQQSESRWTVKAMERVLCHIFVAEGNAYVESWEHAQGFGSRRSSTTFAVIMNPDTMRSMVEIDWSDNMCLINKTLS